ncbi:hypothetical protein CKO25_02635 [Thiocapsa imhoffii]|uniref:DUF302 domain-containing protein n=1 Tax=Thiocapsa imhoffii TaxID=382777 RepID=A0A9X0WFG9_9GAMM|nr:DUF302 domain-containing protein [Thiocapsa imhoffii]MBK1643571.1 hypothetical protein [Thiocapsa imhoffii]
MKQLMLVAVLALVVSAPLVAEQELPEVRMSDVEHSVLKLGLAPGVTADDAGQAMLSKAVELNMRLVAHLNVGQEVGSRGLETMRLEIFQFCNPEDAVKMARFNTIFAAYMPCSIALVEDEDGRIWLQMLNLDMLISAYDLPPELQALALTVNGQMLDIIAAGATGEF